MRRYGKRIIFWKTGKEEYLVKTHNKGELRNCTNYRGITLFSVPRKVFNRILLKRMKNIVDP